MAKINFGDYLKSKQRKERIYESDEALVERAKLKLSVDQMVVSPAYRVKNLEAAEKLLSDAKEYPGAEALYDSCKKQLSEAKVLKKEADYQRACRHLEEAREEYEFGKVAGEFANLRGYRDADEKRDYAQKHAKVMNHRFQATRAVVFLVILALVWLIARSYKGGYMNYMAARLEGLGGQYQSAYGRFSKLGDLLDSKEQAEKYRQLSLQEREASEIKVLPKAKKGDIVSFAGQNWLVLRRSHRKLLMICRAPSADSVFRGVQFHNVRKNISWADSSLRAFLNGGVLQGEFTDLEREVLVEMTYTPSGNDLYGVFSSSNPLTDKVRIFDLEDLKTYSDVFKKPAVDMWLAAPGHELSSAAYQSSAGIVMLYGDDVTDMNLSVCPVITVDLDVLKSQDGQQ